MGRREAEAGREMGKAREVEGMSEEGEGGREHVCGGRRAAEGQAHGEGVAGRGGWGGGAGRAALSRPLGAAPAQRLRLNK